MLYVELLLFGACVGVVSGMLGVGGGVILVPGLMLLFGFTQQQAQGTSLAALSMPILIFAAVVYARNNFVQYPQTAAVALGIMLGAYLGARLVPYVPANALRLGFGGLVIYVGCLFVFGPYLPRSAAALPAGTAAVVVALGAWLRGRRAAAGMKLPPPDSQHEYHI